MTPMLEAAMNAATAAGVASGLAVGDSVLLQDTNNVVVWLRPHAVIAKVGVRPNVGVSLLREVEVCRYLYGVGAPVAEPLAWFDDERLPVSLWNQIEMTGREYSSRDHGVALEIVHAALRGYEAPLPSYWSATDQAREALYDDNQMRALPYADVSILRSAFERFAAEVLAIDTPVQPLHGDPHSGNTIMTERGAVLIDFEAVSTGPVEWDFACCPVGVAEAFPNLNHDLVRVARLLNAVRVATWCWASPHPAMRSYAVEHLELVRRSLTL
jgi:hypothetical protein